MRGRERVGGLVSRTWGTLTVTASYWDTATSGQASSAGGTGQTTGALQAPTGYTGLYAGWNVDLDGDGSADDPWHFGAATDYPVLQVDVNGDGTASWAEFGSQPRGMPAAPTNVAAAPGDARAVLTWDDARDFTILKHQVQQNGGNLDGHRRQCPG